jgi:soluble lytic murein transglycosylase-like protein
VTIDAISQIQARMAAIEAGFNRTPPLGVAQTANPVANTSFDTALATAMGSDPAAGTAASSGLGAPAASAWTPPPAADGRPGGPAAPGTYKLRGDSQYTELFKAAGERHGIDPAVLEAVARAESGFRADARSGAGAQGLMQIMPGTAKGLGVNPLDPVQAVDGAARLLAGNLKTFGSLDLALAAYNAGGGAVKKYGGIPPFKETQNYVRKINGYLGAA